MNFRDKCQEISDKILKESFPEVGQIRFFEMKRLGLFGIYLPVLNLIGINRKCNDFSELELRGILAHEICHAELCRRYGKVKSFFLFFYYWINSSFRIGEEIRTDSLAIQKGYSKELIQISKRLEKLYPKQKDKTYMSVNSIKSYSRGAGL